jgi:LPXTG-motif cell wall-anchored protein
MNQRHQGGKRAGVIAAAGVATLIGTGVLASSASAHVPTWSNTCDSVTINLTQYNAKVTNTVELKADGQDVIAPTTFGSSYSDTVSLPDHTSPIKLELIVKAGDDRRGKHGWSVDKTATADVCQTTPTSPPPSSSTPPPSTSSSPTTTPSASPTQSVPATPTPSASATAPGLADTGASSATPVIAGAAAVVVVAGGALVLVTRKRRSSN